MTDTNKIDFEKLHIEDADYVADLSGGKLLIQKLKERIAGLKCELSAANEEIERQKEYTFHKGTCQYWIGGVCNCGYKALKSQEKQ